MLFRELLEVHQTFREGASPIAAFLCMAKGTREVWEGLLTPAKASPASPIPRAASLFQLEALTNSVWKEKEKKVKMSVPDELLLFIDSYCALLETNRFPYF